MDSSERGINPVPMTFIYQPFPKQQILNSSKLKKSADDNSKFDENSRKFSKRVENTVGKAEIACYEQLLLFPQCFQKACFPGTSKGVIVWKWVYPRERVLAELQIKTLVTSIFFPFFPQ